MLKKINLVSLGLILILTFLLPSLVDASRGFSDVSNNHWANGEISFLTEKGIIKGYSDGDFKPGDKTKRIHIATMIVRAKELSTNNRPDPSLKDVDSKYSSFDIIKAVMDEGLFDDVVKNGEFKPNQELTRAEMASIIVKAYGLEGTSDKDFKDVPKSHWSYTYVQALAANDITTGYSDGTFKPDISLERAQFSAFISRVLDDKFKPGNNDNTKNDMKVHYLDVGQGDSTFIELPNGKTILIDAGTQTAGQKIVSYLKKAGITTIDLIVATHPHADHIGGLIPVLEELKVNKVLDSGVNHTSQTYLNYLKLIDENDIPFEIAKRDAKITLDSDVEILVLTNGVDGETVNNLNDYSVSLKITYDDVSFLFTGDLEGDTEKELAQYYGNKLKSDFYQVGHHGSDTSSAQELLDVVAPKVAVFSYGEGNSYGHPHKEVLDRLYAMNVETYFTPTGNVIVTTDGVTYTIDGESDTIVSPGDPTDGESDGNDVAYPININTADLETLQNITGVGPVKAQRIIDYRNQHGPFEKKEQIKSVSGIGDVTYEKMKGEITV